MEAYCRRALDGELGRLALAIEGERNDALNRAAYSCAQLLHAGVFSREELEQRLTEMALARGLTEAETEATIRSGIEAGMAEPRNLAAIGRPAVPFPGFQAQSPNGVSSREGEKGAKEGPHLIALPDLLAMDIPPPNWAVPGLLCEGLTLLAGKPKLGKSIFALNVALTIAAGGMALKRTRVESGDVLYLALEDTARRLQGRSRKILEGLNQEASYRLGFATRWPREHEGGLAEIRAWAKEADRPALVVVDVWAKFRPAYSPGNQYDQDYQFGAALKEIADEFAMAAVAVHHTKKAVAEDVFDEISGTLGINGAADSMLVLSRARNDNEAVLHMTGRDVDEGKLAVVFEPATLTWENQGPEGERTSGRVRGKILEQYRALGGAAFFPSDMAQAIEEEVQTVKKEMWRMARDGVLRKVGHKYAYPGPEISGTDGEMAF